jgi:hypothetical protein
VIAYFDTSAFIKLLIDEPGTVDAVELWETADRRFSSRLLYPEARAALAAASRAGRLDVGTLAAARGELERLRNALEEIELTAELACRAGDLAEALALRGYDAVHLAAAEAVLDDDGVLAAPDGRLAVGAQALGIAVAYLPSGSGEK